MSDKAPGLFKFWHSLLLVALPAALGIALYFSVISPLANRDAAVLNVESIARVKAGAIDNSLQVLSGQIEGLSRLSELRAAIANGDQSELDIMASEWALMFTNLNQLAILPLGDLGTADLGRHKHKLRNNIEKDIVERARGDERVVIDIYQLDGRYVVSLARAVKAGSRSVGAILLTLKADWLLEQLQTLAGQGQLSNAGVTRLFYSVAGSHPALILSDSNTQRVQQVVASASQGLRTSPNITLEYGLLAAPAVLGKATPILLAVLLAGAGLGVLALLGQISATGKIVARDSGLFGAFVSESFDQATSLPAFTFPGFKDAAEQFTQALERYRSKRAAASKAAGSSAAGIDVSETGADWENPALAPKIDVQEDARKQADERGAAAAQHALPAHIFRAYDIRGVAETELDDANVELVGKAIGMAAIRAGHEQLVVGRDGRLSSERIRESLVKSLLATGCDVIDIGLVPTPLVYFAAERLETHAAVMITGSHNPPEYNGLKVVLDGVALADEQIQQLYQLASAGKFPQGAGDLTRQDVVDRYIDYIADDVVFASQLKVVLDCGNGAASEIAPMLFASLGCEVVPLFAEIDGNFPNHMPDPGKPENIQALVDEVASQQADLGLAFDGDGDRVVAVTSSGRVVDADLLLMLFAKDVLTRNPGADVVYDVKCTRNLSQVVSAHGGRPVMWQSGHSRIKQKMLETGALLGGEFSGHFFFKERWFGFDDGLYSGTRLVEMLTLEGLSLDEALQELPTSACSPEFDIPVEESAKFDIIEQLATHPELAEGEISRLDGLRVDYADGWGLVRASNTSSKLTARFEADSEPGLEKIQASFAAALAAVDPGLALTS